MVKLAPCTLPARLQLSALPYPESVSCRAYRVLFSGSLAVCVQVPVQVTPLLLLLLLCRLTATGTEIVCDSWLVRKQLLDLVLRQLHVVS
jgi:hypothetical protein